MRGQHQTKAGRSPRQATPEPYEKFVIIGAPVSSIVRAWWKHGPGHRLAARQHTFRPYLGRLYHSLRRRLIPTQACAGCQKLRRLLEKPKPRPANSGNRPAQCRSATGFAYGGGVISNHGEKSEAANDAAQTLFYRVARAFVLALTSKKARVSLGSPGSDREDSRDGGQGLGPVSDLAPARPRRKGRFHYLDR